MPWWTSWARGGTEAASPDGIGRVPALARAFTERNTLVTSRGSAARLPTRQSHALALASFALDVTVEGGISSEGRPRTFTRIVSVRLLSPRP